MKCAASRLIKLSLFLCVIALFGMTPLHAQQIAVSPGIITTIAGIPGSTTVGSKGDCAGVATTCSLFYATNDDAQKIAIDSSGNIYFADRYFNVIRKLSPTTTPGTTGNLYGASTTYTMTTIAGASPVACTVTANAAAGIESPANGDGCAATAASISIPYSVALNSAGTILFVSDLNHGTIRAINLSSTTQTWGTVTLNAGDIYTVMGTGSRVAPADHEDGSSIATSDPVQGAHGISIDPSGNLIDADYSAVTIRKLVPSSVANTVTTIVGGNTTSATSPITVGDGVNCTTFKNAYGAAPCGDGNLAAPPTTPSTSAAIQISNPEYALVDSRGNIYIASNSVDFRVRVVNNTGADETIFGVPVAAGTIATIAGNGVAGASGDGGNAAENPSFPTTSAQVNAPNTVALDPGGSLYLSDGNTNEIRRIDPKGIITTLAGHYGSTTNCSFATDTIGDGCPATAATLRTPEAAVVDPFGNLFIVDAGNYVLREVSATTSALSFSSTPFGSTTAAQILTIYNTGAQNLVLSALTITGNFSQSGGTCTATSTLAPGASCTIPVVFAPQSVGALTGSVSVTSNATNVLSISLTGTGTLQPSITTVSVSPNPANVGQNVTFTATVAGTSSVPTGTVTLNIGSTVVGPLILTSASSTTATATYSTSTLAPGPYAITVAYSGSGTFTVSSSSSTTLTVSSSPISTTALTLSPATPIYGQPVTLKASVSALAGASGTVTFMDGSIVLGISPLSGTTASLTVPGLPLGTNNLTASYSGDANNLGSTSVAVPATLVQGPAILFTPAIISTVAGNGLIGYTGDGGGATSASLNSVNGVALDASSNVYIADQSNNVIRVVNTQKTVITVAGVTIQPGAIATVAGSGALCSVTGSLPYSSCGDGGSATSATLNTPAYVRLDAAGNIYIADTKDNTIRVVNTQSFPVTIAGTTVAPSAIATIAGNGTACGTPTGTNACGDNGPASAALLKTPRGVFVDPAGNIYITDNGDYRIRVINAKTNVISTVAGTGSSCNGQACGDGGQATVATLGSAHAVYVDAKGQIYIADDTDNRVRLVNTAGVISTIVGNGIAGLPVSGTAATSTPLDYPGDMIADGAGNVYVAMQANVIGMVNPAGVLTFIAGTESPNPLSPPGCTSATATTVSNCYAGDGGSALQANLNAPQSIAMDPQGNLYFAESANNVIRKITIGRSVAAFANQPEGTASSAQTIGVLNTGGQPLQLSQLTFPTGFIQETVGSDCVSTASLAPGAGCSLGIGFMPPTAMSFSGTAAVSSNSANATAGTNLISLTGTGTYTVPTVTLTPSLSFGNQPVAVSSAAQTLTLTNTGSSPFPISSAVLGDTTNFTETTNCPTVLSAGSNCTYSIVFDPSIAGAIMTNFTVTDTTDSVSATAQISGTGTVSAATLSATAISLGTQPVNITSAPQSLTVTNSGVAPLVISAIKFTGANPTNFGQTSNCGSSIASGASCTIQLTFTPSSIATFTANLVLTDNAPGSPQSVALTGTGVAQAPSISFSPPSLAFGTVPVGTSSTAQVVTVTNNGTAVLSLSGVSVTGTGYTETTTCGAQLAPNATCAVSVKFTPTTATSAIGALSFSDNAAASPQTVALSGTGTAPQGVLSPNSINFGSQSTTVASSPMIVTLTNPGNAVLTIGSIAISGANANLFSQTNSCGSTLAINASCTISITFAPTVNGADAATLVVTDSAANSPQTAALSGTGTAPAPAVSLSSPTVTFGQVPLGSSSAIQTVVLTNSGSATLSVASIGVSGAGFTQTNNCGTQVAASATCTISVSFTPSTATATTGSITITDNALGTVGSVQTVALTGTGTAPAVTLTPSSINFGTSVPGTPATSQIIVVTNSGNASLSITNFLINGNTGTVFTLSTTCSALLAAGTSCNVTLGFNPAGATTYNASFNLIDNANNVSGSNQSVALTGVGAYAGSFTLTPSSSPAKTVPAGDATNFTIMVSPVGTTYNGPVTFAVTGVPTGTVAIFTPPSVVPGATGNSTNLLIEVPVASIKIPMSGRSSGTVLAFLTPLSLLALIGFPRKLRKSRGAPLVWILVLASLGTLAGCGSSTSTGPKVTSYPLTITGTCGTAQSTTSVTLVVQSF